MTATPSHGFGQAEPKRQLAAAIIALAALGLVDVAREVFRLPRSERFGVRAVTLSLFFLTLLGKGTVESAKHLRRAAFGAVCGTGQGEAFIRLALAHLMVIELQHGMSAVAVAKGAVAMLGKAMKASGGVIVISREGGPQAAFNTPAMPFALAT